MPVDRLFQDMSGIRAVLVAYVRPGAHVLAGGIVDELLDRFGLPAAQPVFECVELPREDGEPAFLALQGSPYVVARTARRRLVNIGWAGGQPLEIFLFGHCVVTIRDTASCTPNSCPLESCSQGFEKRPDRRLIAFHP